MSSGGSRGPAAGTSRIRLLHVDDDDDFRELATSMLARELPATSVTTAPDASTGLEALAEGEFDCVVSDYDMPGTDGLSFLEAVRERHGDLPFVLFTGKGSEEIASEAISAGVTDYLQKGGGREQYAMLANRIENAVERYRAERAVEETRRWHQRLIEASTDVILVVDPDGTIRYLSPSVERVLGYDAGELTGDNAFDFVHPDDRAAVEEAHAAVVDGDETVPAVRFRCRHAGGSWVTLESRSRNLLDDATIRGVVVYVRDVSDRRERERELARYESIVEASGDVVYALDPDGRFTFANEAHESLTGYAAEEVLGEHVSAVMREEDVERGRGIIRDLLRDDDRDCETFEMDVLTRDGERLPVENHVALLTDEEGEFIGSTGVLRDISARRERERELERYARMVGAMGDGVYALDPQGRHVEFNDYVVELTGYDREELVGASPSLWYDDEDVARFERAIQELLSEEDGATKTVEATLHTADGDDVVVEVNLALMPSEDGEFRGTVGVIRDVTDRREREEQLERYETIVDRVPNGVFVLDAEGVVVDGNATAARMVGQDPEAFVGERFDRLVEDDVVGEEVLEDYPDAVRDLLSDETGTEEATFQYDVSLDGDERVYEVCIALRPYDEEFRGTIGIVQDVTERKEREFELERYERIVGAMGDGVYAMDEAGRYTMVNDHMLELNGYDRETALGAGPDLVHEEEDIERFESAIKDLNVAGDVDVKTVEATLRTAEGEPVPIEVNLTLLPTEDGEFRGTVGVVRDVAERKEREEALERYETVVEASGDGVYTLDEEGRYTFMNRANADILGRSPEDMLGEHVSTVMGEEDIRKSEALIRDLLSSGRDHDTLELDVFDSDGQRVTTETHIGLLPAPEGEFRGTVGFVRDISERKERERALERYETLVETSGDAMYALDADGHYTFVNEALADLRGYEKGAMLGEHVSTFLDGEDIEQGQALIRELLESDDRQSGTFEMDVVRRDGERVPVENHVALLPTEDDEFRGTAGVLRDISERKEREEALRRQNERLDRFAKMVSHDLRNPLNVAAGRVQMERKQNDSDNLEKTQEALLRMDDMVDDVLSLAREGQQVVEPGEVPLEPCVDDAWETIDAASGSLSIEGDLGALVADHSRLRQLLENLFRNAVEHAGPDVTVRVGRLRGDGGAGFYVEDDGPGVPAAERARVFEFGHSGSGDGTGFGLTIVKEIAAAHGWEVVATEGGAGGARFEFTGVEWVDAG